MTCVGSSMIEQHNERTVISFNRLLREVGYGMKPIVNNRER